MRTLRSPIERFFWLTPESKSKIFLVFLRARRAEKSALGALKNNGYLKDLAEHTYLLKNDKFFCMIFSFSDENILLAVLTAFDSWALSPGECGECWIFAERSSAACFQRFLAGSEASGNPKNKASQFLEAGSGVSCDCTD